MESEQRLENIFDSYIKRISLLLDEMRAELLELLGSKEFGQVEIDLGDLRKVAILKECLETEEEYGLMRQHLSMISCKYGRRPATCGVFFRPDVNLMETRGKNNQRFVTQKGRELVSKFIARFGEECIMHNIDVLQDSRIPDSFKLKIRVEKREPKHE